MNKIFYLCLTPLVLYAKTLFTQDMITSYLNVSNPYFYATHAQQYINKEKEKTFQSAFDTQLNMKYDNKQYPTTQGEYKAVDITKSIGNGMEFSVAYRNAQDTQEYNNIKTGKDGELYTSINIPILSLINNTSKNELNYQVAKLTTKELSQTSKKNLLSLYLISTQAYFQLLLYHDIYKTEEELLHSAELNYDFILKEVKSGKLAEIALIDVKSQIINRKQRLLSSQNKYQTTKNTFLKYLNLSEKKFDELYVLPSIKVHKQTDNLYSNAQELVLHNRPEFQELEYLLEKTDLKSKYNTLKKYPKLNMKLHSVYDLEYEKDGYKVSMEFNFPLERSTYKGKKEVYKKEALLLKNTKQTILNNIQTDIRNIIQKISLQEKNIALAIEEISLVKRLEDAEKRKYHEGMSSLIFVNQREVLTLKAKQKLLHYYFQLQLLDLQLKFETGTL